MSKGRKIAVTILSVFGLFFITGIILPLGVSKTFVGLLGLGLFLGLRALWKKPTTSESSEIKLDKTTDDTNENSSLK